jgi:acyl-CoA thioesterase-1
MQLSKRNISVLSPLSVLLPLLILLFIFTSANSKNNQVTTNTTNTTNITNTTNTINTINTTNTNKTILILGDSISSAYGLSPSQGWVALLGSKLARSHNRVHTQYRVQNASLSGDTTAGGVQRLPALLKQYKPAIVIIELGGNDALRGLPLAQTKSNFETMLSVSKKANAQIILLPMQIPPNYGSRYTQTFNGLYNQLAKANGVNVTPFIFKDFAENMTYFQSDRIHPTAAAQPLILSTILPTLEKILK